MKGSLTKLNVNPCKMCMPMGAVTALYGIKKCMTLLHGSQGCSTYIRRHMATHFNEPVDIASSSLTEEGTVYGGERNLIQGLLNLIKVYEPEVIAVATTCLAETIGEDINRIVEHFYSEYPQYRNITIIPINSAGYSGTQYEGFQNALYQLVKSIPMDTAKNNKVNIITNQLSCADTRYIKELLETFEIDYILLPDLSDNLDGGYQPSYQKLPLGGTALSEISKMAGAQLTIEISSFPEDKLSIGKYLSEQYGVPYITCNSPIGLKDNDTFLRLLSEVSGKGVPYKLRRERGRYLDAVIDAHKYCAEARIAVYGEPDFVFAMVHFCIECGVMPVLAATGSGCKGFKEQLKKIIQPLAELYAIERYEIIDDADFQSIEELSRELGVNLFLGNSDGRRIADRLGVKLIRRGFPIHDHLGGQRLRSFGYEGAMTMLDEVTNAIVDRKHGSFRKLLYDQYYKGKNAELPNSTATHPCFSCSSAHQYARMHLPIAPRCNISCNYCLRKFDCPNESRPGVTTKVLKPEEALERFIEVRKKLPNLSVVGIAGPGDALANMEETRKTLQLIRQQDPNITFCLSTNGLLLPQYAMDLVELGITHLTVTVNAVDPKIGAQIYRHVEYMGRKYQGELAAAILLANQLTGIKLMTAHGVTCKVNIVMLKGINEEHIPEIVDRMKELGVTMTNIMSLIPVKGSVFENLEPLPEEALSAMRKQCQKTLKQMYHCRQCRADAIGTLFEDKEPKPSEVSDYELRIAVASKKGIAVDQHFGQATEFYIYEYKNGNISLKERRPVTKYCRGIEDCDEGEDKVGQSIETISDCHAMIALRIGEIPKALLQERGIQVFTDCDYIEASIKKLIGCAQKAV
jgi:nitrogenase molybdenum-iron protein alpha/beta subunit/MoaA/NifB/PqqE/SkfB family radical SAM enzyme